MQKYVNVHGKPYQVVSGGARGADTMGEEWARGRGIYTRILLPDWNTHGRAAGTMRNTDIVNASDKLIAFYKNGSRGTMDSIRKARIKLGVGNVTVIECT